MMDELAKVVDKAFDEFCEEEAEIFCEFPAYTQGQQYVHDELAGKIIGYLPPDVQRYCQTLAVGNRLQLHHGIYYLRTLLDVSTSEERVTSSAALKKKVDVKKADLVAFLRYKVHMRQLENSDMIDKNGDYAEFVAVLEHVAKGGNEDFRYSTSKWRDDHRKPVKKTPRAYYEDLMSHLTTQAMRHYPRGNGSEAQDTTTEKMKARASAVFG